MKITGFDDAAVERPTEDVVTVTERLLRSLNVCWVSQVVLHCIVEGDKNKCGNSRDFGLLCIVGK